MNLKSHALWILAMMLLAAPQAWSQGRPRRVDVQVQKSGLSVSWGNPQHEVQVGLSPGTFQSTKVGNSSVTIIQARGSYARHLKQNWQVGGEGAFYSTSGGAKSQSYFEAFGFGNYNFDLDLKKSFYAKAGLGMFSVLNDKSDYESKFGFMVGAGKRFPLWDRVQYNPEFRLFKKGSQDPTFELQFLTISLMF